MVTARKLPVCPAQGKGQDRPQRSNFGGDLNWWDHLFGIYVGTPASSYRTVPLGLSGHSAARASPLQATLMVLFAR